EAQTIVPVAVRVAKQRLQAAECRVLLDLGAEQRFAIAQRSLQLRNQELAGQADVGHGSCRANAERALCVRTAHPKDAHRGAGGTPPAEGRSRTPPLPVSVRTGSCGLGPRSRRSTAPARPSASPRRIGTSSA